MSKIELLQGTLDMLVLKRLNGGAMHGHPIARPIQQTSDDDLNAEEDSLYPSLNRMDRKGWIKCVWGLSENSRKARYHELTRVGRKQPESERVSRDRLADAVSKVMQPA